MSSYIQKTKHPKTGEWEDAQWLDDYFGRHHYGVKFDDGYVVDPWKEDVETSGKRGESEREISFILSALRKSPDLAFMSEREKEIIFRYYGLEGWMPHTLDQIGKVIKSVNYHRSPLGRERIRQLKCVAIERIKQFLSSNVENNKTKAEGV